MPIYHSEQRQIEAARRQSPDPLVSLHPDTATALKLTDDDWVRVVTPQGSIRARASLTDILDPCMVDVQHGRWFPERKVVESELYGVFESNANILYPDGPEFCCLGSVAGLTLPSCVELKRNREYQIACEVRYI